MGDVFEIPSMARVENMRAKLKRIRLKSWLIVGLFAIIGIVLVVAGICTSIKVVSYVSIAPFAIAFGVMVGYFVYEAKTEERIKEIVFEDITAGRR